VAEVAENWLRRHVEKNKHRTAAEMRRQIEKYVLPYWRDRIFVEIKRKDFTALLDMIEDKHGPAMADAILCTLRSIAGWLQKRDDDYSPPFVRGMRRVRAEVHNRSRMLSDDELRRIWNSAGEMGQFGAFVRLLLLTAQRRDKVGTLRWDDINASGVWTIRTEERDEKSSSTVDR
jgi:integrase